MALAFVVATVGYRYRELIEPAYMKDGLLWALWLGMTAAMVWRFEPMRDGGLMLVAGLGGFVIEWWGTNTQLWHYFTAERPPLWIVPAWPVATIAIDRLARLLRRPLERLAFGSTAILLAFVVAMVTFAWPTVQVPATQVVVVLMLGVVLLRPRPERDVVLFLCGTLVGLFLEWWGTTRRCWTYFTLETPPPEAVAAHGFASVAFGRAHDLAGTLLAMASSATTTWLPAWGGARQGREVAKPTDLDGTGLAEIGVGAKGAIEAELEHATSECVSQRGGIVGPAPARD